VSPAPARGEVVGIQYLRAVAAIMVVLHHVRDQLPGLQGLIPTTALQGGVDIFFVISGFIMTYTMAMKPLTPGAFLERRVVRIVPLYWTMTAFTAVLAAGAPRLFRDTKFTLWGLITSMVFFPTHNVGKPEQISPLLKLGWTLNYEMFFYVVFACVLFLAPFKRAAALLVIFGLIVWLVPLAHSTVAPVAFYSEPIILEFVFGCFIGAAIARGPMRVPAWALWASLLVGVGLLLYFGGGSTDGISRILNLGLAAGVIVFSVAGLDRSGQFAENGSIPRLWKLLGDASYSIYLAHLFPLILFRTVWEKVGLHVSGTPSAVIFIVTSSIVSIAAGVAVYLCVERPLTDRAKSLLRQVNSRTRKLRAST